MSCLFHPKFADYRFDTGFRYSTLIRLKIRIRETSGNKDFNREGAQRRTAARPNAEESRSALPIDADPGFPKPVLVFK
jgi:hypothetical protein